MEISIAAHEGVRDVLVVSIEGKVDASTADTLRLRLEAQIAEGNTRLVGDFSRVEYISSAGLRALLSVVKEARQRGGECVMAGAKGPVLKILELSGVTPFIKNYEDVDSAAASLSA